MTFNGGYFIDVKKNVGHRVVCEYVAEKHGWSPEKTKLTSSSKCDFTARSKEGLVLIEGEGLSAKANTSPLHILGHLTHFLAFSLRHYPDVAEIVWVVAKEKEKELLETTFKNWFALMHAINANIEEMPKMKIVMVDLQSLEKIKKGIGGEYIVGEWEIAAY